MKSIKVLILIIVAAVPAVLFARAAFAAGGFVAVGITKYQGVASVAIGSNAINVYQSENGTPVYTFESGQGFTISRAGSGLALSNDGGTLCELDGLLIQGTDGLTRLGGVSYRGYIKPVAASSGVTIVNMIEEEQYLYGVVPAEMPASWGMEALKAQAVAARCYMRVRSGVHSQNGYDICDTIHCQAYTGTSKEHERTTDAVNQTAGVLAYYGGQPILSVFSASSGGRTENAENIWGEATPYLRGVREVAEKEFLQWSRTYTLAQLGEGLRAGGTNIGSVTSLNAEYLPSGRVVRLTINGTNGSKTYEKDAVRGVSTQIDGALPSIMFMINGYAWSQNGVWDGGTADNGGTGEVYVLGAGGQKTVRSVADVYASGGSDSGAATKPSSALSVLSGSGERGTYSQSQTASGSGTNTITVTSNVVVFEGRGNGHGVGLSQYGAKGMAEEGYDYISILKHYYTGIEVY